jgi:hypothetical protein
VKKLREQLSFELTYNSNAIEGNKVTHKEMYLLIKDGMTVKGKSLKYSSRSLLDLLSAHGGEGGI